MLKLDPRIIINKFSRSTRLKNKFTPSSYNVTIHFQQVKTLTIVNGLK